jgi:pimeloyl-ACP methyl ester carboxylesterase
MMLMGIIGNCIHALLKKMNQALILIPGLMCDATSWQPTLELLPSRIDYKVVDHGQASNLVTMAEHLLQHAPARFALAGHSMGGRVALEVMRLAPERVTHLALLDTGFLPKSSGTAGQMEQDKRFALLQIAQTQGVRTMAQNWVQGMVASHRLTDTALIESIVGMFERKTAAIFENQIQALLNRPDASDVLARLSLPTMVLCGQDDSWSNVAQHQAMANLIPAHPSVIAVPQAGHMVMMESPEDVARHIVQWLES